MGGYAIVRWSKSVLGILWRYSIFIIVNPVQKLDLFNIRPLEWPPKCWKMPKEIILLSSLFLTNQNNVNFDKVNHKVQKSDRYDKWTVYQGFHLKHCEYVHLKLQHRLLKAEAEFWYWGHYRLPLLELFEL